MVHSIYVNNNPKLFKFALYFDLGSIHAHIVLWINDIDVDRIMNEIIAHLQDPRRFGKNHELSLGKPRSS
jgi:hypothetical protein